MILADKIIELRKRNGWSQEELSEKLDVSRQSISKWESAQSIPDMNRLIAMSQIFGVSLDSLLKDEIDITPSPAAADYSGPSAKVVTVEEAYDYLAHKNTAANRVAIGVMLCILSPVLLIGLAGARETGLLGISEIQATAIGVTALLLLIGAAVALFVTTGLMGERFTYIEEEPIDTVYGVDGIVRERREKFRNTHALQLTVGIVLCVIAAIPIFIAQITHYSDNSDFIVTLGVCTLLAMIAIGVMFIVRCSIVWGGFHALLEEGDYSRDEKRESKKDGTVAGIYWLLVTAAFLAYSFITGDWGRSWIIWPVAGVLFAVVISIAKSIRKRG